MEAYNGKNGIRLFGQMYYGSDVHIKTYLTKIGNSSFVIAHEAWQNGHLRAQGSAVLAHFDFLEQKSKPIPTSIQKLLEEHLVEE